MSEQVFQTRYETYRTAVESYLETLFAGSPDWRDLYESMRYSLLAGGKRIRPVLTLELPAGGPCGLEDGPAHGLRPGAGPHLLPDPRRPALYG